MPKFVFNLGPLLHVRARAEEAAQRALAAHERERVRLEELLRTQHQGLTDSSHALRDRLVGRLDVHELRLHASAALRGERDARMLVLELAGVHRNIEAARKQLLEARQQRKAIEILRERRYEAWRAAVERQEDVLLDEIATRSAAHDFEESDA